MYVPFAHLRKETIPAPRAGPRPRRSGIDFVWAVATSDRRSAGAGWEQGGNRPGRQRQLANFGVEPQPADAFGQVTAGRPCHGPILELPRWIARKLERQADVAPRVIDDDDGGLTV